MKTVVRAGWAWYKKCLARYPVCTKAITSSVIMSASDVLCQEVEITVAHDIIQNRGPNVYLQGGCPTNVMCCDTDDNKNEKLLRHDWFRTSHVAITGLALSGPMSHAWYAILERVVTIRHHFLGVAVRMLLDAAVFSPVAVASYFALRTALEGKGLGGIVTKLETKWQGALLASWQFWPLANVINFGLVPVPYRVLYNNSLSLFWNGYLSHLNGKQLDEVATDRIQNPDRFETKDGICQAQEQAEKAVCVCSHCRHVRA